MPNPEPEHFKRQVGRVLFLHLVCWTALLTLVALNSIPAAEPPQQAQLPAALKEAEKAIKDAEALSGSGPSTGEDFADFGKRENERTKLMPRLKKADAALTNYIERNPKDIEAMFLQVRLDLVKQVMTPVEISGGKVQPQDVPGADRDPQKTLDRILEIDPSNAVACFLKARFYGMGTVELEGRRRDLKKAVQYAQMAVERAPEKAEYRSVLAAYLVMQGNRAAAKEVASHIAGGRNPLHRLLADSLKVPVPEGAVEDAEMSASLGRLNMPEDPFSLLRTVSYTVAGSAAEIEAFYGRQWKGFKFRRDSEEDLEALFDWQGEELVLIPNDLAVAEEKAGLVLMLSEFRNPDVDTRKHFKMPKGDTFCHLLIINSRPVDPVRP